MKKQDVAFLRGVNNIGAGKRVAMVELRALFESLGFRDVRTVRNSGNVVFSVPSNRRAEFVARIEKALVRRFGLAVQVTLLSGDEVTAAVRENPFAKVAKKPSQLLVIVPRSRADGIKLKPLLRGRWTPEALALGNRVAYVWCAKGIPRSPLWLAVDRALERTGTARNLATMTKLLSLVQASG